VWRLDACCCVCGIEVSGSINGGPRILVSNFFCPFAFVVFVVVKEEKEEEDSKRLHTVWN
jgi:hypothetical protein